MRRLTYLLMVSLLAMLILVPTAVAQNDMEQTVIMEDTNGMVEQTVPVAGEGIEGEVPDTGGPGILLPAAALLVGAGVLTFAVIRRRT